MELDKGNVENLKGTLSEGPSEDVGDEPWIFKISCDDDVIMPLPPLADGDEPLL